MTKPMSRDTMRGLKATYEEGARVQQVAQVVQRVYHDAVQTASSKMDTSYNYPLPQAHRGGGADPFYLKNMPDILAGLQELFPDCDVSHTLISRGADGKMYDISKLDEKILPFVNTAMTQSHIVIDWS